MRNYAAGQELPVNRWVNPFYLLYAVPNQSPKDVISLLGRCGIDVIINDTPIPPDKPYNPYRELAVAILLQAIHDAYYATNHKDRAEARCWLLTDNEWFPQWCHIIDLDYREVRSKIEHQLAKSMPPNKYCTVHQRPGRPSQQERTYVVH